MCEFQCEMSKCCICIVQCQVNLLLMQWPQTLLNGIGDLYIRFKFVQNRAIANDVRTKTKCIQH